MTSIKIGKREEDLSDSNIEKVIKLLESESKETKITKKAACEYLGIAYNTTRLGTLIESYKNKIAHRDKMRKERRGKPATQDEIQYVVREYMGGSPVSRIADDLYRGSQFVHSVLESMHVPVRPKSQNYFKPELIPDNAVRTEFAIGEKVYSARYDSLARIDALVEEKSEKVYRIYLTDEKWQMNAYQPASELASLENLIKAGIKL